MHVNQIAEPCLSLKESSDSSILTCKIPIADINGVQMMRELIPGQLAYAAIDTDNILRVRNQLQDRKICLVSYTLHKEYTPFCSDFGPVDLGVVTRFCQHLSHTLEQCRQDKTTTLYHFEPTFASEANASFLLGAFLLLHFKKSPQEAAAPFIGSDSPLRLRPFRDASFQRQTYSLTLLDCLHALSKAVDLSWYNPSSFDIETYDALKDPFLGEITQICPKFVAFKGPIDASDDRCIPGETVCTPGEYVEVFSRLGVTCVVRLNDPDTYDRTEFTRNGIHHRDLYFDDCTTPPDDIVEAFLDLCDTERVLAVHCRAGLGRTGTLIALWMMRRMGFKASESIAWLRIARPGSIIGPQQQFLADAELWAWAGNRPARGSAGALSPVDTDATEASAGGGGSGGAFTFVEHRGTAQEADAQALACDLAVGMARRLHSLCGDAAMLTQGDDSPRNAAAAASDARQGSTDWCRGGGLPAAATPSSPAAALATASRLPPRRLSNATISECLSDEDEGLSSKACVGSRTGRLMRMRSLAVPCRRSSLRNAESSGAGGSA